MPVGATSWSFTEDDFGAINQLLQRFLFDSNARCALLVDRSGQLVTTSGDRPTFDVLTDEALMAAHRLELPWGFDPRRIDSLPG